MRALLLLALLAPALAGAATEPDAVAIVSANLTEAHAIAARGGERAARLAALHAVARRLVDTERMGREAAGPAFSAASPTQQAEFLDLFDELLVRSYLQKLLFFRSPRFAVGRSEQVGESVVVHTKILTRKDEFYVDYTMRRLPAGWRATDIVVEGLSLATNYRAQLRDLLRERSFEELLALMRRKVHGIRQRSTQ